MSQNIKKQSITNKIHGYSISCVILFAIIFAFFIDNKKSKAYLIAEQRSHDPTKGIDRKNGIRILL
jgi:hypothetical protein